MEEVFRTVHGGYRDPFISLQQGDLTSACLLPDRADRVTSVVANTVVKQRDKQTDQQGFSATLNCHTKVWMRGAKDSR